MNLRSALQFYAGIARKEILRDHARSSCIAATWITLEVFRRLGFSGASLPAKVSVGNGAYARRVSMGGPPKSMADLVRWGDEDGSYVVGLGFEPSADGIGGHLSALIDGEFLVDASVDQASVEQHSLRVPSVLVLQLKPGELASGIIRRASADLFVEYLLSPTVADYTSSPDWGRTPEVQAAVERILAAFADSAVSRS